MKKDVLILGIESSCDETAVSVVRNGREVLSDAILSSATEHVPFGGVVPEIASRAHTEAIDIAYSQALKDAGVTMADIDAVAVTYGAGLLGALLVGVSYAKAIAYAENKPLIAVNHIRGHVAAGYLSSDLKPPFLTLLTSGGHTAIVRVDGFTKMHVLGSTRDDAVGEAFDKVARVLGIPYPGGPGVMKAAKTGYIVMAALYCLAGILLIIFPDISTKAVGIILAVGMIVFGCVKLVGYFSKDLFRLAFQHDFALGLLMIVLGVVVLLRPMSAMGFICVVIGISMTVDGLFRVQMSMDAKAFGVKSWWVVLILAILTVAAGIALVFHPVGGTQVLMVLLGISLLMEGILSLSVVICMVRIVKHQQPDVIETEDYEIRKD